MGINEKVAGKTGYITMLGLSAALVVGCAAQKELVEDARVTVKIGFVDYIDTTNQSGRIVHTVSYWNEANQPVWITRISANGNYFARADSEGVAKIKIPPGDYNVMVGDSSAVQQSRNFSLEPGPDYIGFQLEKKSSVYKRMLQKTMPRK